MNTGQMSLNPFDLTIVKKTCQSSSLIDSAVTMHKYFRLDFNKLDFRSMTPDLPHSLQPHDKGLCDTVQAPSYATLGSLAIIVKQVQPKIDCYPIHQ